MTPAMEQKLDELKRSIEDRFNKQKDSLREIISEICSALFDSLKKDLKEEMKKEMDEQITKISSENCIFQNQILELKHANVKLQNELDELEQYGRFSCIRIDGIPEVSNESSEDVFNNIVDMFVRAGIEDIEQNIDRAHRIGESYHHKKSKMDSRLRKAKSFTDFKKNISSFIRPKVNRVFNCNSSKGLKFVTRLCLGLSHLREHKFKHSFQDSINPLCSCSLDVESTIHYFLHCPRFTIERHTVLNTISQIDNKLLDSNESNLIQYLLFGDPSKDTETNTEILNVTVNYVLTTKRFDERLF